MKQKLRRSNKLTCEMLKKYLQFVCVYVIISNVGLLNTETYRSGHNEHDWKSCCRDERHVGSNPTVSAN